MKNFFLGFMFGYFVLNLNQNPKNNEKF